VTGVQTCALPISMDSVSSAVPQSSVLRNEKYETHH
jgi:hypothetical protein